MRFAVSSLCAILAHDVERFEKIGDRPTATTEEDLLWMLDVFLNLAIVSPLVWARHAYQSTLRWSTEPYVIIDISYSLSTIISVAHFRISSESISTLSKSAHPFEVRIRYQQHLRTYDYVNLFSIGILRIGCRSLNRRQANA